MKNKIKYFAVDLFVDIFDCGPINPNKEALVFIQDHPEIEVITISIELGMVEKTLHISTIITYKEGE